MENTIIKWVGNSMSMVKKYPILDEYFKGFSEYYDEFFCDSEEIGSSDGNICIMRWLEDHHETTWKNIEPMFKEFDVPLRWFFICNGHIESWSI